MKPYLTLILFCSLNFACKHKDDDIIPEIKVQLITVTGNDIADGKTSAMVATVMPVNANNKNVIWSVSDETFASISAEGILTAKKNGTITVKAMAADGSGIEGTKQISITGSTIKVNAINVSGNDISLGTTTQMTAVVSPADAANKNITWSVSDATLASISESGMLIVKNNGTVTVTAMAADGSGIIGTKTVSISSFISFNRVDLALEAGTAVTGTVTVQIQNSASETLGTVTTSTSNIPVGQAWDTFTFSPSLVLVAGAKYRISITRSKNGDMSDMIFWRTSLGGNDAYPQGVPDVSPAWVLDFAFRTYSNDKVDQEQTSTIYGFTLGIVPRWQEFTPTKK
jgi:hypothetical protein